MKNNLLLVWAIITIITIGISVFINYWFIIPRIEKNKYISIEIYTYNTNSNDYNRIINESIEENINKMYDRHISHLNVSITLFSVCLGIFTIIFGVFYILKINEIQKMLMEKSNKKLYNELKYLLRKDNIDKLKQHMHIPILILYECDITKSSKSQEELIKRGINNIFKEKSFMLLKKQITKLKENNIYNYESIKFHIILFPCVDKYKIIDNINNMAKNYMQYE